MSEGFGFAAVVLFCFTFADRADDIRMILFGVMVLCLVLCAITGCVEKIMNTKLEIARKAVVEAEWHAKVPRDG